MNGNWGFYFAVILVIHYVLKHCGNWIYYLRCNCICTLSHLVMLT
jgi:hypothetical protein